MMTCAIRSLHKAYPGRFEVDVRSPCNEIFQYSPYITPLHPADNQKELNIIEELKKDENHPPIELEGIKYLIAHYPEISRSGMTGAHFSDGHRLFLSKQLGIAIPATGLQPDIFFSPTEIASANPVHKFSQYRGRYWVINAGIKNDYTLKWYNNYQEVVDLLQGKIQFVQVGHSAHTHPALKGVIDLRGKTNLRQLFRVCRDADGLLNCVSMNMVIAAALKKPCVVVAGAREGVRWQINPDHQFLYRNGVMSCASYDGCWKSRTEECINKHLKTGQPLCMELIRPEDIARSIELYYLGGRLPELDTMKNNFTVTKKEEPMPVKQEIPVPLNVEEAPIESKQINFTLDQRNRMVNAHIFNILRILKKYNPKDEYLEAYQWHYAKRGENFMDSYHVMHWIGSNFAPKRILEIGCRTGVSICQLLSSYFKYDAIEKVFLCDIFAEMGSPDSVKANLEILNIPTDRIQFIKGSSIEEMPRLIADGQTFDYILVDGCHDKEYAKMDLIHAHALIEQGGFILFDDITPDGCSLQDVWDDFKQTYRQQFEFYEDHNGKGIGIARKK
jgi:ADP-heptose:LPS heptosyltransferase/predicted O-methyltransferase YrrM